MTELAPLSSIVSPQRVGKTCDCRLKKTKVISHQQLSTRKQISIVHVKDTVLDKVKVNSASSTKWCIVFHVGM